MIQFENLTHEELAAYKQAHRRQRPGGEYSETVVEYIFEAGEIDALLSYLHDNRQPIRRAQILEKGLRDVEKIVDPEDFDHKTSTMRWLRETISKALRAAANV